MKADEVKDDKKEAVVEETKPDAVMTEETKDSPSTEQKRVKISQINKSTLKALIQGFLTGKITCESREGKHDELSEVLSLQEESSKLCLEIYETFPLFLAHDGHFFVSVVYSKECWAKLR